MSEVRSAAARQRVLGFVWDYLVIAAWMTILLLVSLAARPALPDLDAIRVMRPWQFDLMAFAVLVLPAFAYFALSEASSRAATWGKGRVGLRVVTTGGGKVGAMRSCLRSGLKLLPWQMAHTALFHIPGWPLAPETPPSWVLAVLAAAYGLVGVYLLGLSSSARLTLYDRVAGTKVVTRGEHDEGDPLHF